MKDTVIRYGMEPTPLGIVFVAVSAKGVCAVKLLGAREKAVALEEVKRLFPEARLVRDDRATAPVIRQIGTALAGKKAAVRLDLRGTPFQRRVWQELQAMPSASTCSYSELARRIGKPRAVRAVASACARNPVAIFVPCHRVVRQDGGLGGYRWGLQRKQALLQCESEY